MARRRTASADKTDLGIYFLRLFIDLGEMVLQNRLEVNVVM